MPPHNPLVGSPMMMPVAAPDAMPRIEPSVARRVRKLSPSTTAALILALSIVGLISLDMAGFKTTIAVGKS